MGAVKPSSRAILHDAHLALWSSYADQPRKKLKKGPRSPLAIEDVPERLRQSAKIPRPIRTLAAMNLLSRYPKRVPSDLRALVTESMSATVKEIRRDYGEVRDPFLVLAELFGILDYQTSIRTEVVDDEIESYRKESAKSGGKGKLWHLKPLETSLQKGSFGPGTFGARLELCLQQPLKELKLLIDPKSWFKRCELFWKPPDDQGEDEQGKAPKAPRPGKHSVRGALRLPVGRGGVEKPVDLRMSITTDPFEAVNRYAFTAAPDIDLCVGKLVVQKERGRPGATRIIHEKRVRYGAGSALEDVPQQTVTYWVEAETLCLFLPG